MMHCGTFEGTRARDASSSCATRSNGLASERAGGGAGEAHVRYALANAERCYAVENDRWRVTGPDLDGDELSAIVVIEDGVIVVTVL